MTLYLFYVSYPPDANDTDTAVLIKLMNENIFEKFKQLLTKDSGKTCNLRLVYSM